MPHRQIVDHVRQKICISDGSKSFDMTEDEISRELGVGRQHVRDCFHALAFGGLIEILPNDAARVPPLDVDERDTAFEVYREIAGAAANYSHMMPVPVPVAELMRSAAGWLDHPTPSPLRHLKSMSCMGDAMCILVPDKVMSHSLEAAHWRVTRWLSDDFREEPATTWRSAQAAMHALVDTLGTNEAGYVMRTAAGISGHFIRNALLRSVR